MSEVFADTFYWVALTVRADPARWRACEFRGSIVTTDEVLIEYLNFCCGVPELRRKTAFNVQSILRDPKVRVIRQGRETFLAGLELYEARSDKSYSLTDCISMQTMRYMGLTDALTNDRHFEQEGFRALFRN